MAPVASTVRNLSHLDGISDSARARELYKYYQPTAPVDTNPSLSGPTSQNNALDDESEPDPEINIESDVTSSKISSPDTALTAFCQLVTFRTGAQRAMISVIDAETQYFLAESTKTVDLIDNTKHEPGDDIWMGCSSVSKAGRLCEQTIATAPTEPGAYPSFIVDDLSKDPRFDKLPFVTEAPFLKFYGGVPLITKRGIPIGSLFIVDDRVGLGLSREKINFMGTMAATIMQHMEMTREVEERRRGMKMSRGLASFVEGRAELAEAEADVDNEEGTKIAGQFESEATFTRTMSKGSAKDSVISATGSIGSVERKEKEYSAALASSTEQQILAQTESSLPDDSSVTRPHSDKNSPPNSFGGTSISGTASHEVSDNTARSPGEEESSEATSMKLLFSRAANLIREAFEVDGGAVFYDAQTGFSSELNKRTAPVAQKKAINMAETSFDGHTSSNELYPPGEHNHDLEALISTPAFLTPQVGEPSMLSEVSYSRTTGANTKTAEILGFSTADASSINGDLPPGPLAFQPLQEKALQVFLKRYPRGKLWTFDSDGAVSSSSEEEMFVKPAKSPSRRQKDLRKWKMRSQRNRSDAMFLSRHFPGVRQLLFVPLWDAGRSHWLSGCFAWSTEPTRVLSKQSELAFLTAFGNCVMAEWSRIDTEIADQKKGDFIGSISHELRSPLHGILASAEFLAEVCSGWEGHLVETIDSCGRTLLDTINHILDFSKINHFEKNWHRNQRGNRSARGESNPLALRQSDLPMLSLFQDVDISVICEEVVESVFAGHVFQNITAQSFDSVPSSHEKMSTRSNEPDMRKFVIPDKDILGDMEKTNHSGVWVILDVDPQNYHFTTQPGALRRLIMNLLGNALKYTSHGYVRIKLEATSMEDLYTPPTGGGENIARCQVTLTVTDTGKGISADFLRSKLFMPFAQENSLSSGTGLGLSIVRKIVSLLEGDITIDSEIGRGTRVKVTLPLLRDLPKTGSSSNSTTIKSNSSTPHDVEESILNLHLRANTGLRVFLSGFDIPTKDPIIREMYLLLKDSVTTFLTKWYGFKIVPFGTKSHLIISNEEAPSTITSLSQISFQTFGTRPSILVLCSHNTKFNRFNNINNDSKIGYVAKPVGPVKLAKAILQCLDGAPPAQVPGLEHGVPDKGKQKDEEKILSEVFEELSLGSIGGEVLDNSRMAMDSDNARKAIESPTPNAIREKEKGAEFPFPQPHPDAGDISQNLVPLALSIPTTVAQLNSIQNPKPEEATATTSSTATKDLNPNPKTKKKKKNPSLLVVDDNQINQRLLSTYLERRGYEIVDMASNGLEAVNMVHNRKEGYDIIFMDITMPVLDGFGATRQIRGLEAARRGGSDGGGVVGSGEGVEGGGREDGNPALIIAFTGRSSLEDQNEAVRVGLDLFMTKPVAFKEVGKIIDNWVSNKEREEGDGGA